SRPFRLLAIKPEARHVGMEKTDRQEKGLLQSRQALALVGLAIDADIVMIADAVTVEERARQILRVVMAVRRRGGPGRAEIVRVLVVALSEHLPIVEQGEIHRLHLAEIVDD